LWFAYTFQSEGEIALLNIQQHLQQTGDFLTLTRQYPDELPSRCQFQLQHEGKPDLLVTVHQTGILEFSPLDQTLLSNAKDIVLSSGVHGNETAPIEICDHLIKQILLGDLACFHRVMFIFGNPPAMNAGTRFIEENLNRLFSGGHSIDQGQGAGLINQERHRALALEKAVAQFFKQGEQYTETRQRFHYDLHTAIRGSKHEKFAVYPFLHGKPWNKQQIQFLGACGVNTILLSGSPTTTFSYYSSHQFGAHAFTVELGKVRPFGENDMTKFAQTQSTLAKLIANENLALGDYRAEDFHIYKISQVINRQTAQFKLHFADDVENFTAFRQGDILATDGEKQYVARQDGEAIIFPNANVAIGQRALLTVVPTRID
jgi:succinylglutamate desuccinylase